MAGMYGIVNGIGFMYYWFMVRVGMIEFGNWLSMWLLILLSGSWLVRFGVLGVVQLWMKATDKFEQVNEIIKY